MTHQSGFFDPPPQSAAFRPSPSVGVQTSIDAASAIDPHVGVMRDQVLHLIRDRGDAARDRRRGPRRLAHEGRYGPGPPLRAA